jgi:hypothetical protein
VRWAWGAGLALAGTLWSAAPAGAAPAPAVEEHCPYGDDGSGIRAEVTGLPSGGRVTFTVTGGRTTVGPVTFTSSDGRVGISVGFGVRVESARVEAILRSDGDGVVEPGEQLVVATMARPCWSNAK